ncbi:MAG: hypothetical protein U0694_20610 [Anaerolineae bacterium]
MASTWWMLASGRWVREDVVDAAGDCTALPVVTDIPPLPTAVPTLAANTSNGSIVYLNLNGPGTCTPNPPIYRVGTRYQIGFGRGATSGAEADAAVAAATSTITINGALAPATHHRDDCPADGAGVRALLVIPAIIQSTSGFPLSRARIPSWVQAMIFTMASVFHRWTPVP